MKPLNFFLTLLIIIIVNGCAGTGETGVVKPVPNFQWSKHSAYHLWKNDITGDCYLTYEHNGRVDYCITADSTTCIDYIRQAEKDKLDEVAQKKRDAEIRHAWHEVNLPEVK